MGKKDPRIDAYIARSPEFAKPILAHLRKLVHAACPNVEETIKWGVPFYTYHGIVCSTAAFKQHCMFIPWNRAVRAKYKKLGISTQEVSRFRRFAGLDELPEAPVLKRLLAESARLNAAGEKGPARTRAKPKPTLATPADLRAALAKNKRARATFDGFSKAKRNEYIVWITEAKRAETRTKRVATTIEWLAAGKARNWKYEKC